MAVHVLPILSALRARRIAPVRDAEEKLHGIHR
jgi:hypothetical protein